MEPWLKTTALLLIEQDASGAAAQIVNSLKTSHSVGFTAGNDPRPSCDSLSWPVIQIVFNALLGNILYRIHKL